MYYEVMLITNGNLDPWSPGWHCHMNITLLSKLDLWHNTEYVDGWQGTWAQIHSQTQQRHSATAVENSRCERDWKLWGGWRRKNYGSRKPLHSRREYSSVAIRRFCIPSWPPWHLHPPSHFKPLTAIWRKLVQNVFWNTGETLGIEGKAGWSKSWFWCTL